MAKLKKRTMNYIVDDLIHPYVRKYPELKLVDILLHFVIEGDPRRSLGKTLRYDIPELIDEIAARNQTDFRPNRRRRTRS